MVKVQGRCVVHKAARMEKEFCLACGVKVQGRCEVHNAARMEQDISSVYVVNVDMYSSSQRYTNGTRD